MPRWAAASCCLNACRSLARRLLRRHRDGYSGHGDGGGCGDSGGCRGCRDDRYCSYSGVTCTAAAETNTA
jgi:hypothetical protein